MTVRFRASLAALLLLAGVALAPVALAEDPTPGTEQTAEVDLTSEPLVPYIAALLVTSGGLLAVGLIAMRVTRRPPAGPARRGRGAWWPCGACGESNAPDRDRCYACGVARGRPADAGDDGGGPGGRPTGDPDGGRPTGDPDGGRPTGDPDGGPGG